MDFLNSSKLNRVLKFNANTPAEDISPNFSTKKSSEGFTLGSIDDQKIHRLNTSKSEPAQTEHSLLENLQPFSIQKDNSYKSLGIQQRESALTKSLRNTLESKTYDIYLFGSTDRLSISSDLNASLATLTQLTENAYRKSEYFSKYGSEGPFKLYPRQNMSFSADCTQNLDMNSALKDLDTGTFVMLQEENNILRVWINGKTIKFECRDFKVVADLFESLNSRGVEICTNPAEFEFIAKINDSDQFIVPLDLPISQLNFRDLYLHQKHFADQPDKNTTSKEFTVYSVNKNGKEKQRKLEINQTKIFIYKTSRILKSKKKEREILRKDIRSVTRDFEDALTFYVEYIIKRKTETLTYKSSDPSDTDKIILGLN